MQKSCRFAKFEEIVPPLWFRYLMLGTNTQPARPRHITRPKNFPWAILINQFQISNDLCTYACQSRSARIARQVREHVVCQKSLKLQGITIGYTEWHRKEHGELSLLQFYPVLPFLDKTLRHVENQKCKVGR